MWTKGALSAATAKVMVFKLVVATSESWRRLRGGDQLLSVEAYVNF